jgi:hypothetical protein
VLRTECQNKTRDDWCSACSVSGASATCTACYGRGINSGAQGAPIRLDPTTKKASGAVAPAFFSLILVNTRHAAWHQQAKLCTAEPAIGRCDPHGAVPGSTAAACSSSHEAFLLLMPSMLQCVSTCPASVTGCKSGCKADGKCADGAAQPPTGASAGRSCPTAPTAASGVLTIINGFRRRHG